MTNGITSSVREITRRVCAAAHLRTPNDAPALAHKSVRQQWHTDPTLPAKKPRVNVVLERPQYDAPGWLARGRGISLTTQARDLLRGALETRENIALAEITAERERSLDRNR